MMRYFKNPVTDTIYGYDTSLDHQVEHMNQRIIDENLIDITDTWTPPEDPPAEPPVNLNDLQQQIAALSAQLAALTGNK